MGNYWDPMVSHRELYSVPYGDLAEKEIQKKGIYVYV